MGRPIATAIFLALQLLFPAQAFLDRLQLAAGDQATIVSFNAGAVVDHGLTPDRDALDAALVGIHIADERMIQDRAFGLRAVLTELGLLGEAATTGTATTGTTATTAVAAA